MNYQEMCNARPKPVPEHTGWIETLFCCMRDFDNQAADLAVTAPSAAANLRQWRGNVRKFILMETGRHG